MGIGSKIRYYRELRGLTQSELADMMGYKHHSSIGKIEAGIADIPLSTVSKFAEVLRVDELDLLGLTNKDEEYLPYLKKAQDWQLKAVREILGMPQEEEKVLHLPAGTKVG